MRVKSGYLRIGRLRGASLRLHWTVPLGVALLTGLRFAPGAWLGVVVLLVVHELGHALAVARGGLRLTAVDVLGFGGLCRFEGYLTPRRRVLIAWSGVLAQAALGLATLGAVTWLGHPARPFAEDLVGALLYANLWMILVNLLPLRPFDGAEAWGIIALLTAARARRRLEVAEARAVADRARARAALPLALHPLDDPDEPLPPMPDEVRRVLDRIMAEGRAQHESAKKK
jgi:Zn-dependent protease